MPETLPIRAACPCGGTAFAPVFSYREPPPGETPFAATARREYAREVVRCVTCGHLLAAHTLDLGALYRGDYVTSTYGAGLEAAFRRIVELSPERSDNVGRVARVTAFAAARFGDARPKPVLLDVGSGLCVFLHGMKAAGWDCVALDPDPRSAAHARDVVGVRAVTSDFMAAESLPCADLITFNKVLEHVVDPAAMLRKALRALAPGGLIYVEVPDGEAAVAEGPGREEFFVDHLHVFSAASLALLLAGAGLTVARLERLREPSGKFTLWAFAAAAASGRPQGSTQERA